MATWGIGAGFTELDTTFVTWVRMHPGLFNPGANATLDSVELLIAGASAGALRVGLYQGGTSDSDPDGATRLEDLGSQACTSSVWNTWTSSSNPTLTNNTRLWIAVKGNGGTSIPYTGTSGEAGDFYTATGRINLVGYSDSPSNTWPDPIAPTSSSGGAFWYPWRINYTLVGGGGAAATERSMPRGQGRGSGRGAMARAMAGGMELINGIWRPPTKVWVPVGIQLKGA